MKNLAFKFYSVLKNEDAMPYLGDDLLVVADGLGGSGSVVHHIDRMKHTNLHSEIMASVFKDIPHASPELTQYIMEWIAPMLDDMDDTSALWASRIVIARCVYALTEGEFRGARLDDGNVRADLAEFIAKGLSDAVKAFDLESGKYDNQLLLPTTLALIRYTEEEDRVIAETVWAGDSRCYALTPSGLKLLSIDDEDGSGSITNLFYADNSTVQLHYLRHEMQKPCILMAVSDGVFDPFDPHDHLGVEHTLLSAIAESNCETELSEALCQFYDKVHADDATMTFVPFGFADFAAMKEALKDRTDKIMAIMQKQADMRSSLEVVNLTEEEATHYVASRTADRYDYIIPALIDALDHRIDDVAISAEVRGIADNKLKIIRDSVEKARRERRQRALAELEKHVLSHPEDLIPDTETTILSSSGGALRERFYTELKQAAERYLQQKRNNDESASEGSDLASRRDELHKVICEKIDTHQRRFDELWDEDKRTALAQRKETAAILSGWYFIDNALYALCPLQECAIHERLPKQEREFAFAVREYLDELRRWNRNRANQKKDFDAAKGSYVQAWKKVYGRLMDDERLIYDLFSQEAIVRFGFADPDDASASEIAVCEKVGSVKEFKERKASIVSGIVQALASGYDRTSVIDSQYNATKLNLFRTYYRMQADPDDKTREFAQELLLLEAEYTSLVDHGDI